MLFYGDIRIPKIAYNQMLADMVSSLGIALVGALVFGLVSFGPDRQRVAPDSPTQLITVSGRIGLVVGVATGLIIGLPLGLSPSWWGFALSNGLVFGLLVGLMTGLDAVVYHFAFLLWLRTHRNGPLRWVSFLEWATAHLVLRSTGAAYEWVHLELRDNMAKEYTSTPDPIAPATSQIATCRTH
jgi:hypothetical protein